MVGHYLPWLGFIVGTGLVLGLLHRACAALAGAMGVAFAVAVSSALYRGIDISCGCFSTSSTISWKHLVFDLFLAAVGLTVALTHNSWGTLESRFPRASERLQGSPGGWLFLTTLLLNTTLLIFLPSPPWGPASTSTVPNSTDSPIIFDPPKLDFGQVPQNQTSRETVRYTNISTETNTLSSTPSGAKSRSLHLVPMVSKAPFTPTTFSDFKFPTPHSGRIQPPGSPGSKVSMGKSAPPL